MAMLEMVGVSKTYGAGEQMVHALRDISLAVAAGELVAVMGPSGSGKSSLLTIAGTLEDATSGDVRIDGAVIGELRAGGRAALRRRTIGFVFQDFNLLAGLTAAENVSMPMELDGRSAKSARLAALAALGELGLEDRADRYPDDLSGGERQRVAIARAIVGERRLVLADEPTGALDTATGEQIVELIKSVRAQRGTTIVLVTNDPDVATAADRILRIRDGRIEDAPTPAAAPRSVSG